MGASSTTSRAASTNLPIDIGRLSCCRFHGHRVKVDEGTGGRQWDDDGLIGRSSSRR